MICLSNSCLYQLVALILSNNEKYMINFRLIKLNYLKSIRSKFLYSDAFQRATREKQLEETKHLKQLRKR